MQKFFLTKLALPVFFLCLALGLNGCYKDKAENLYPKVYTGGACDTANVTYAAVEALYNAKCVSCHPGVSSPMNTYATAKTLAATSLVRVLKPTGDSQHMPQNGPKLSDCQIATIRQWIAQGYKQ